MTETQRYCKDCKYCYTSPDGKGHFCVGHYEWIGDPTNETCDPEYWAMMDKDIF